jgi:hypothetical protein
MTYTASLENCKRLYELSGWSQTRFAWSGFKSPKIIDGRQNLTPEFNQYPAYDSGYLLRKLPDSIHNHEHDFTTRFNTKKIGENYFVEYSNHLWWRNNKGKFTRLGFDTSHDDMAYMVKPICADTPEDALCKLSIRLFEQGILKRGESNPTLSDIASPNPSPEASKVLDKAIKNAAKMQEQVSKKAKAIKGDS